MPSSKTKPISKIEAHGVYDIEGTANVLGASKRTVQQYVREGKIKPAVKVGKQYRITGDNILSFLGSATISRIKLDKDKTR